MLYNCEVFCCFDVFGKMLSSYWVASSSRHEIFVLWKLAFFAHGLYYIMTCENYKAFIKTLFYVNILCAPIYTNNNNKDSYPKTNVRIFKLNIT